MISDPNGVAQPDNQTMATCTRIICHIVFATKHRERVLAEPRREDLFRYIWGIVNNHDCHLFRLNGVEDHIHILTSLHPTVALADFVKAGKNRQFQVDQGEQRIPAIQPLAGWLRRIHPFHPGKRTAY